MRDKPRQTGDRDTAVERLLQRMPAGADTAAPGPCLELETLAAWMDGTLSAGERGAAERHAAGCDRCQAMLAAMVRSEPPPLRPARWWSAGTIRWAAPLVAGAAVFALWVAVDPEALRGPKAPAVARVEAPAPAPPVIAGNRPAATPAPQLSDAAPAAKDLSAAKIARPARKEVASRADRVAAPATAPPALDKTADAVAPPVAQANERTAGAAPEVRSQAAPAAAGAAGGRAFAARAAAEASPLVIASPAASTRWRIVSPNRVERSADAGVTWMATALPPGAQVAAGASPSADVCWLVGRDGLVLRTVDGSTWTRIAFPEPLALTAVESFGTESAVVTAEGGRAFATTDGGRIWVARPE